MTSVTHTIIGLICIKKIGGERDKKFRTTLKRLEPFLLKKLQNNIRFEDIEQGENKKYTHYFYSLSPEIKDDLKKETLLFDNYESSNYFYGFEDPTFYIDDVMAGCVISHEDQLVLYLTDEGKKKFNDKGFIFKTKDTVINGSVIF